MCNLMTWVSMRYRDGVKYVKSYGSERSVSNKLLVVLCYDDYFDTVR